VFDPAEVMNFLFGCPARESINNNKHQLRIDLMFNRSSIINKFLLSAFQSTGARHNQSITAVKLSGVHLPTCLGEFKVKLSVRPLKLTVTVTMNSFRPSINPRLSIHKRNLLD